MEREKNQKRKKRRYYTPLAEIKRQMFLDSWLGPGTYDDFMKNRRDEDEPKEKQDEN